MTKRAGHNSEVSKFLWDNIHRLESEAREDFLNRKSVVAHHKLKESQRLRKVLMNAE